MIDPTSARPVYAAALDAYWEAGWRGILPLPAGQKKPVPKGYTGRDAADPSYPDCYSWAEEAPGSNLALRLPNDVIGIDVDHYDGKDGGGTLGALVAQYGPLPDTWMTGSRNDGVSGIRLFKVPEGLRWPGDLGGGIEIIQARHRYAIAWPSVHPKGGTYVWTHPDCGEPEEGTVPKVSWLPDLPQAWVDGLTGGLAEQNIQSADLDLKDAAKWIDTHGAGTECRLTEYAAAGYINELATGTRSRHEVIKDATMRLCHMAAEGHRGSRAALGRTRSAFLAAMAGDSRELDAPAEWDRLILGALRIAAMDTVEPSDPCDNPLHGLMEHAPASPSHLLGPTPATPKPATPATPAADQGAESLDGLLADPHDGEGLEGLLIQEDAPAAQPEVNEAPAPSWRPVDLAAYLDGTYQPERPTMFTRTDGVSLIYPGLVHDIHGESESGKSLVAQAICAGLILEGQEVIYLDFESGPGPMAQRMLAFGCSPEQIMERFIYVRPELNPYALTETESFRELLGRRPALVVLDGVTDALVQFGAGSDSNDEITKWHRYVPRTIADRTRAAIILIDHVVKSSESRGRFAIGGQAKLATIDGASYAAEIVEPIGKGMRGSIMLRVGKDRPGTIRPQCGAWRASDRSQEAVRVVIDSSADPDRIVWEFLPPESSVTDAPEEDRPRAKFVPTGAMERAYRAVVIHPAGRVSRNQLVELLAARYPETKRSTLAQAVALLIADGHLINAGGQLIPGPVYHQPGEPEADQSLKGLVEYVDDSYGRNTSQPTML
jgi:hypothetical protein